MSCGDILLVENVLSFLQKICKSILGRIFQVAEPILVGTKNKKDDDEEEVIQGIRVHDASFSAPMEVYSELCWQGSQVKRVTLVCRCGVHGPQQEGTTSDVADPSENHSWNWLVDSSSKTVSQLRLIGCYGDCNIEEWPVSAAERLGTFITSLDNHLETLELINSNVALSRALPQSYALGKPKWRLVPRPPTPVAISTRERVNRNPPCPSVVDGLLSVVSAKNLKRLCLSGMPRHVILPFLERHPFDDAPNLKNLEVTNCGLKHDYDKVLSALLEPTVSLVELNLDSNGISQLNVMVKVGLPSSIQTLSIQNHYTLKLTNDTIESLICLADRYRRLNRIHFPRPFRARDKTAFKRLLCHIFSNWAGRGWLSSIAGDSQQQMILSSLFPRILERALRTNSSGVSATKQALYYLQDRPNVDRNSMARDLTDIQTSALYLLLQSKLVIVHTTWNGP